MISKRVIIIGAGISGLSLGCYLQNNGYETKIVEMSNVSGGVRRTFSIKDYNFELVDDRVLGFSEEVSYNRIWQELGVFSPDRQTHHEIWKQVELSDGRRVNLYSSLEKFKQELIKMSPEDTEAIAELMDAAEKLTKLPLPLEKSREMLSGMDYFNLITKNFKFLWFYNKWSRISVVDFVESFKNNGLKELIISLFPDKESSMVDLLYLLVGLNCKDAGYIRNGMGSLIKELENRYLALNGKILFESKVKKIIVKENRATGVLSGEEEIPADRVISTADIMETIYEQLSGNYVEDQIKDSLEKFPIYPSFIHVFLGLNLEIVEDASQFSMPIPKEWKKLGGIFGNRMDVRILDGDSGLVPEKKTGVVLSIKTGWEYWEALAGSELGPEKLDQELQRMKNEVLSFVEQRWPGARDKVEAFDMITPNRVTALTGNRRGSTRGYLATPETHSMHLKKTLSGLSQFYMTGHWTISGGAGHLLVLESRRLAERICFEDKVTFEPTLKVALSV